MSQVNHLYFTQISQTSKENSTLHNLPLKKIQFSKDLLKLNFPSFKIKSTLVLYFHNKSTVDIGTVVKWEVMLTIPYTHSALAKPTQLPLLGYRGKTIQKNSYTTREKTMFQ